MLGCFSDAFLFAIVFTFPLSFAFAFAFLTLAFSFTFAFVLVLLLTLTFAFAFACVKLLTLAFAAFLRALFALVILVIVDPNVNVVAGGSFVVPPPDSDAEGEESTKEDVTAETGEGLQGTEFNPGPRENPNVFGHSETL